MTQSIKVTLARHQAAAIETCARQWRRKFRDHRRLEGNRIREAEIRARGLRLYAAWATTRPALSSAESTFLTWKANPALFDFTD